MKILIVTDRFPEPPLDGTRIKAFHLIRGLAARHDVILLTFQDRQDRVRAGAAVESWCSKVVTCERPKSWGILKRAGGLLLGRKPISLRWQYSPTLKKHLAAICADDAIDVVHLDTIAMIQYAPSIPETIRVIGAPNDCMSLHMRRRASNVRAGGLVERAYFVTEYIRMQRFERYIYGYTDACIVTTPKDAVALRDIGVTSEVRVIPNGIDAKHFAPQCDRKCERVRWGEEVDDRAVRLLFTGNMSTASSESGALWLIEKLLPRLRERGIRSVLSIAGRDPTRRVLDAAGRSEACVIVTGFVDDLRPWLWSADIYVCPLFVGSGIKNRVLEALAAGLPVLGTPQAMEWLDTSRYPAAQVADSVDAMSDAIAEWWSGAPGLLGARGRGNRRVVSVEYCWEAMVGAFECVYRKGSLGFADCKAT